MTFKISGSRLYRSYRDKKDNYYIESLRTRNLTIVSMDDWEDFYKMVQTVDRHIKKRSEGSGCQ